MDDITRQQYETQSKDLRVKIKTWEALFQKEHDGSKPGKDDIKRNPKIAATYKQYQKVRNILDGKIALPRQGEEDKENRRKRRSPNTLTSATPSTKRFKPAETPSSRHHGQDAHNHLGQYTPGGAPAAVTPSLSRKLFSPVVPTSIGPTPQRDGRVLGIFDHLPFKDAEIDSPCRPNASTRINDHNKAGGRENAVEETPRKSNRTTDTIALGRTPSSRHKHHHQQQQQHQSPRKSLLATPLKPHDGNRVAKTPSTSSSSVSRLQFATPAFLRRIPMAKITEGSEYVSPEPLRLPRKPLLRGLSSVVADLRKLQEEQLDDDLDALREMEGEAGSDNNNNKRAPPKQTDSATATYDSGAQQTTKEKEDDEAAAMLTADHQSLLGGFDDEGKFDNPDGDEETAGLDRDGRPLRVYKKKGQKRTTRKANMRPVRAKRPPSTTTPGEEDSVAKETLDDGDEDVIAETQPHATARGDRQEGEQDPALLSGSDFAASEDEDYDDDDQDELAQDIPTTTSRKTIRKSAPTTTTTATKHKKAVTANKPTEGPIKKAARKVNELAHANFRRLKLRNNGAKGGPGYNSRFRRRR